MRMSKLYAPTLKEDPTDAEIASHRLLLRAGMIRKTASGVYTFLPLGQRVLAKVEAIVRDEMNAIGSQEIMMPALQPSELWHESGRWDDYGPELMRLVDRHDHGFCLRPTHEELITSLVRNELRSYKQLPASLSPNPGEVPRRDPSALRPSALARVHHEGRIQLPCEPGVAAEDLRRYVRRLRPHLRALRLGLPSGRGRLGQIGGKVTTEFMALAEAGEAELVHCTCGYAANTEAGDCLARPTIYEVDGMEKISTPGIHYHRGPREVPRHPASSTVKALSGKDADGNLVVLFVPGDHELNEIKAERAVPGFTLLTDEEMLAFGLHKARWARSGFLRARASSPLAACRRFPSGSSGANEEGFHYVGARLGEDFRSTNGRIWRGQARRQLPGVRAAPRRRSRHRGVAGLPARRQVLPLHGRDVHGRAGRRAPLHHGLLRRGRLAHAGRHRRAAQRRNGHQVAAVGGSGSRVRHPADHGRRPGPARRRSLRAIWRASASRWSSTTATSARA